jgi:hypothetical protein
MMRRSSKDTVLEAKRLLMEGKSPKAVNELTGVCLPTCYYLKKQFTGKDDSTQEERLKEFKPVIATPEKSTPIIIRPMNEEEIAKYGPPTKIHTQERPEKEFPKKEYPRQAKVIVRNLPIDNVGREAEEIVRSLRFLGATKVNLIIATATGGNND